VIGTAYLAACPAEPHPTHADRRKRMQTDAQAKTQEKISLGALMLTIVISNIAVFLFIAPYS
jgi:hypothetical protein